MMKFSFLIKTLCCTFVLVQSQAHAALKLDRTRIIYPAADRAVSIVVTNESMDYPFLAQSWLENNKGAKSDDYFAVLPPLSRVNAGEKLVLRIEKLPAAETLPQDRESLMYFSVREIPPKSDKDNVLQLSLQTKVKMFYRPAAIANKPKDSELYKQVSLKKNGRSLTINNQSPYYVVLLALIDRGAQNQVIPNVKPLTLEPFSQQNIALEASVPDDLSAVFINDWGGRPEVRYHCDASAICEAANEPVKQD